MALALSPASSGSGSKASGHVNLFIDPVMNWLLHGSVRGWHIEAYLAIIYFPASARFGSSKTQEMFTRSLVQRTVDVFKKTVKSSCHRGLVHLTLAVALSSAPRFGLN